MQYAAGAISRSWYNGGWYNDMWSHNSWDVPGQWYDWYNHGSRHYQQKCLTFTLDGMSLVFIAWAAIVCTLFVFIAGICLGAVLFANQEAFLERFFQRPRQNHTHQTWVSWFRKISRSPDEIEVLAHQQNCSVVAARQWFIAQRRCFNGPNAFEV